MAGVSYEKVPQAARGPAVPIGVELTVRVASGRQLGRGLGNLATRLGDMTLARLFVRADPILGRCDRLRTGMDIDKSLRGVVTLWRGIAPALFGLKPPGGFFLLFLLPRLFLATFLGVRSGLFRHHFPPAML